MPSPSPLASPARAGWNDYELEIAPGFSIYKMNSFEICLGESGGRILVCPSTGHPDRVGPLVGYAVTMESILTRHIDVRRHPKNPFMPDNDPSREFFFIVSRAGRTVAGPFDRATFASRSRVPSEKVRWVTPHNPNFWKPLLGSLLFLSTPSCSSVGHSAFSWWWSLAGGSFDAADIGNRWLVRAAASGVATVWRRRIGRLLARAPVV